MNTEMLEKRRFVLRAKVLIPELLKLARNIIPTGPLSSYNERHHLDLRLRSVLIEIFHRTTTARENISAQFCGDLDEQHTKAAQVLVHAYIACGCAAAIHGLDKLSKVCTAPPTDELIQQLRLRAETALMFFKTELGRIRLEVVCTQDNYAITVLPTAKLIEAQGRLYLAWITCMEQATAANTCNDQVRALRS
jgi:hypothetical protein